MDLYVKAIFMAIDHLTRPVRQMGGKMRAFAAGVRNDFMMAQRRVDSLGHSIGGLVARTAAVGLIGIAMAAGVAARQFVQFDDAVTAATARFKSSDGAAWNAKLTMDKLRAAARKVGAETEFTATQAAQGLDKFALAGFKSNEAIAVLRNQVDLTTVTGEDFKTVADISSDLLGSFGGAALESSKKVAMLKEMNALLAVGTLSANVNMVDLFESLKTAAPIANQMGISMKETIATVSVLGSAGIKGSMAATALKNIFTRIVKPTKDVRAALKALNIQQSEFIDQSTGKMKPITQIFGLIAKRSKGLAPTKMAAAFAGLAGLRGFAGAAIISKNIGEITKQMERMSQDPQAQMRQMAIFMRQSLGNQLKTLGSAALEVGFKFMDAFSGDASSGIKDLTTWLQKVDVQPIIDAMKTLLAVFKFLFAIIRPFIPSIMMMTAAWAAYTIGMTAAAAAKSLYLKTLALSPFHKWALIILAIVGLVWWLSNNWKEFSTTTKVVIGVITALVAIIAVVVTLIKFWTVVQAILNVVMALNPIFLIIMGVALLIAGIVLLVKHWDFVKIKLMEFGAAVMGVFESIGQWFDGLGGKFKVLLAVLFPFITIPVLIWRNWEFLKTKLFEIVALIMGKIAGLLQMAAKLPLIGRFAAAAAGSARQAQANMQARAGGVVRRDSSIMTTNRVVLENRSDGRVTSGGQDVPMGGQLQIAPSG